VQKISVPFPFPAVAPRPPPRHAPDRGREGRRSRGYHRRGPDFARQVLPEAVHTEGDEDQRRAPLDRALGDALAHHDADPDADRVGDHHPRRGPHPDRPDRVVFDRERDRRQLRLVPHLGDEERDCDRPERAEAEALVLPFEAVAADRPEPKEDERGGRDYFDGRERHDRCQPAPGGGGHQVVGHGRHENAPHDRLPAEFRGEGHREQLGLVAHLGEDDEGQ
jgi:hypothetical protein